MACEEACRLILTSDDYAEFVEVESLDGEADDAAFDALPHRNWIYRLLSDKQQPLSKRIAEICNTYDIDLRVRTDAEWLTLLNRLEYLDESHRTRFEVYSSFCTLPARFEEFAERALAYWIFRHCSSALDLEDFRASLGFAIFCLQLIISIVCAESIASEELFFDLARILSEELEYSVDNTEAIKLEFA